MRCDAHVHLWDLGRSPYAWLGDAPEALRRTFHAQEVLPALADRGISRVILVQADDTREDTRLLQELAGSIPGSDPRFRDVGVVAWMPLTDPRRTGEILEDAESMRHVVGVRHLTHDDPDPQFLLREDVGASLDLLAVAGLPLDVPDAFPAQMRQLEQVAAAHPDLVLVLDHLGKPPLGDAEAMDIWRGMLERLADSPNVVAKISGLSTSGSGEAVAIAEAIELSRSLFGAERLMFGSDWPIAPEIGSHSSAATVTWDILSTWPEAEREAVLGRTAQRVYRSR